MVQPEVSAAPSTTMSEKQAPEEVHGISTAVEDTAHVIAGYGETAKKPGAKTKEVHNVSFDIIISRCSDLIENRPNCSQLSRRPRLNDGARLRFTSTVSILIETGPFIEP